METEIEFLPEAREEFDEAVHWYAERNTATSLTFVAEVDAAIEKILAKPDRFPFTHSGCQRCLLRQFPYSIVYYREEDRVVVVAIAHERRRPTFWTNRV